MSLLGLEILESHPENRRLSAEELAEIDAARERGVSWEDIDAHLKAIGRRR